MANILIVGANQGIGLFLVKRLLERGNSVAVLDIQLDAIEALQTAYPHTVFAVHADARDTSGIESGVAQVLRQFGTIDIAVHNACLCTFSAENSTSYETYRNVMDVNYFGALRLVKTVLPAMRKARKGRIIFTSSGVGVTGFPNISPYAASKGAIESLAKCLQLENREYGISFHLFHPPLTDTRSASGLPVPKEFMADAEKVGYGLADHIFSGRFILCHSASQALQMKACYRHPLFLGRMMAKMSQRALDAKT